MCAHTPLSVVCHREKCPCLCPSSRSHRPHGQASICQLPLGTLTSRQITCPNCTLNYVNSHGSPKSACVRHISGMAQTWKREGRGCTCRLSRRGGWRRRTSSSDPGDLMTPDHGTSGSRSEGDQKSPPGMAPDA